MINTSPRRVWRDVLYVLASFLIVIADQVTKSWIRSYPEGSIIYNYPLFQIDHGQNTGAVFGIFQGFSSVLTVVTSGVIIVLLVGVFLYWRRAYFFNNLVARIAVSLYLGGALGNLIDRIRYGSVTDFIDFRWWPAFNVADASMSVAVVLFIYSLLFMAKAEKSNKSQVTSNKSQVTSNK